MPRACALPARVALLAIRIYQRYLSPRKGYTCALRAATGADGCSAYGYSVIERRGLMAGLRLLRRRLDMCALAHLNGQARRHGLLHRQQGFLDVDCGGAACDAGCGNEVASAMDCVSAVYGPTDCCDLPRRRTRTLKAADTKAQEKLRTRTEARKRDLK
jgi:uncharacterized protein